ncbi:MAG: hypothetical protein U0359_04525 [Byssovorax sp.]
MRARTLPNSAPRVFAAIGLALIAAASPAAHAEPTGPAIEPARASLEHERLAFAAAGAERREVRSAAVAYFYRAASARIQGELAAAGRARSDARDGEIRSLAFEEAQERAVALYRLASIDGRRGPPDLGVRRLVELFLHLDEEERRTGARFTWLAEEAEHDLGAALLQLETTKKKGPRALDLVQDSALIPQDRRFTRAIHAALARELEAQGRIDEAIALTERTVRRWPFDRDAPFLQSHLADLHDALAAKAPEGSAARAASQARALAARGAIEKMIGASSWPGERPEPGEIEAAEMLLLRTLRHIAADHTNGASALLEQAIATDEKKKRDPLLERALARYALAAQGWAGYLAQDEGAKDAAESRYWLADALHRQVVIEVALDRSPSPEALAAARNAAVAVRDAAGDDTYRQPAAFMVVDLAQQVLMARHAHFERTHGAEGIERREQVKTTGGDEDPKVVVEPLPPEVLAAITAREEYLARIPTALDVAQNRDLYRYQIGDFYFVYGHFAEAKRLFGPLYVDACGKNELGYKAWSRLIMIANLERDIPEVRRLAEEEMRRPCEIGGCSPPDPRPTSHGYYVEAYRVFMAAQAMPEGPAQRAKWREAGALYGATLRRAPSSDEAPEAAFNGAYAYRMSGDLGAATELYTLFIGAYCTEARLDRLERGDPRATPPSPPDPQRYRESLKFLVQAWDELAITQVMSFEYGSAAATYEDMGRSARLDVGDRRRGAHNAVILAHAIDDRPRLLADRALFLATKPSAKERAELDALVATKPIKASAPPHAHETAARLAADLLPWPVPERP